MENNLIVATAETELTDPAILALQKAMAAHAVNMVVIDYEGGCGMQIKGHLCK